MVIVRWYFADTGVRRSKVRIWESEETAEMTAGFDGLKEVLYVQQPTGRVVMEALRVGTTVSQELV